MRCSQASQCSHRTPQKLLLLLHCSHLQLNRLPLLLIKTTPAQQKQQNDNQPWQLACYLTSLPCPAAHSPRGVCIDANISHLSCSNSLDFSLSTCYLPHLPCLPCLPQANPLTALRRLSTKPTKTLIHKTLFEGSVLVWYSDRGLPQPIEFGGAHTKQTTNPK
jgi:hypothetical protein